MYWLGGSSHRSILLRQLAAAEVAVRSARRSLAEGSVYLVRDIGDDQARGSLRYRWQALVRHYLIFADSLAAKRVLYGGGGNELKQFVGVAETEEQRAESHRKYAAAVRNAQQRRGQCELERPPAFGAAARTEEWRAAVAASDERARLGPGVGTVVRSSSRLWFRDITAGDLRRMVARWGAAVLWARRPGEAAGADHSHGVGRAELPAAGHPRTEESLNQRDQTAAEQHGNDGSGDESGSEVGEWHLEGS